MMIDEYQLNRTTILKKIKKVDKLRMTSYRTKLVFLFIYLFIIIIFLSISIVIITNRKYMHYVGIYIKNKLLLDKVYSLSQSH
jgi:hypothetical protein